MPGLRVANRDRGRRGDEVARRAMLAEVATLYHIDRLRQEQIARLMGRSISMVSRMLAEAEAAGIIEVRVIQPTPVDADLQAAMVSRFGLRVARVLRTTTGDPQHLLHGFGELTARYLSTILHDGATVAVGWGTSLYETVRSVPPTSLRNIHVAQSLGSLGSRLPHIDNHLITRLLAERLHGTPHFLPAPMVVGSAEVRDALMSDPQIKETFSFSRNADILLAGIGVPSSGYSGMLKAGYIDEETLSAIRDSGAVGDVLAHFFDLYGRPCDVPISSRLIGMNLDDVARCGTVIAVAGGAFKAEAILGALRLGMIHILVIDDETARLVLELADRYPMPVGTSEERRVATGPV